MTEDVDKAVVVMQDLVNNYGAESEEQSLETICIALDIKDLTSSKKGEVIKIADDLSGIVDGINTRYTKTLVDEIHNICRRIRAL